MDRPARRRCGCGDRLLPGEGAVCSQCERGQVFVLRRGRPPVTEWGAIASDARRCITLMLLLGLALGLLVIGAGNALAGAL